MRYKAFRDLIPISTVIEFFTNISLFLNSIHNRKQYILIMFD